MRFQGRLFCSGLLLTGLCAGGCFNILSVDSRSGDSSMPPDLRSSSDQRRPAVNAPDLASTQPSMFASIGETFDAPMRKLFGTSYGSIVADLDDQRDPNRRRDALLRLATSYGNRDEGPLLAYRRMAQFDADPLVRAAAIRAINIVRDTSSGAILIENLKSSQPVAVRLEAAKALANMPQAGADELLRTIVASESEPADLRIAAANALRHYRTLANARALISQLGGSNFGLSWQCRRSLYLMTGQDFKYREAAWLEFVTGPERPVG